MLRGDVYRMRPPKGTGGEQSGVRFGVVLQADEFLPRSTVLIAPTSRSAPARSYRPEVEVAGDITRVLVEQLSAIDVGRLGDLEGHLTREELWGIDETLDAILGLR